jgi:hypothetical protein
VLTDLSSTALLIVVGDRAAGFGHVGLGGIAAQLLHHAHCPITDRPFRRRAGE